MDDNPSTFASHFKIQSQVDLDFVIGQKRGYPVGMLRSSPAEFRRRVLAAKLSYELRLKSIDYTLSRYVDSDAYESDDVSLGEAASLYLQEAFDILEDELSELHTQGELPSRPFRSRNHLIQVAAHA